MNRHRPARPRAPSPAWSMALCVLAFIGLTSLAWADEAPAPPSVVARLAWFQGAVSVRPAGAGGWTQAVTNWPLSNGNQVWAGAGGLVDLEAGPQSVRLGADTELTMLNLREAQTQLMLTQGVLEIRVPQLDPGQHVEIDTPNLAYVLDSAGSVRLDVNPQDDSTTVTQGAGSGTAYGGDGAAFTLVGGRQVQFAGSNLQVAAATDHPPPDAFDRWVAMLDARADASAAYVSPWVTGYQGLNAWGVWVRSAEYGPVWFPRVAAGWAPYRDGRWAWVAPWGWTWIADEPWGFAPFHYGRWAWMGGAWGWVPGPRAVPAVYAPALVAFVGAVSGASFNITLANGAPGVAWFPLAPGQIYSPPYTANPAYLVAVNRSAGIPPTGDARLARFNVQRNIEPGWLPPHALTAVPLADFTQGRPVQSVMQSPRLPRGAVLHVGDAARIRHGNNSWLGGARAVPPPAARTNRPVLATRSPVAPPGLRGGFDGAVRVLPPSRLRERRQEAGRVAAPQTLMPLERAGMVPLPQQPAQEFRPGRDSGFGAEPGNPRSERRPDRDDGLALRPDRRDAGRNPPPQTLMPLQRAGMVPLPQAPQAPVPAYVPDRGFMLQAPPAPQPGVVAPPQTPMPLQRSGMLPP